MGLDFDRADARWSYSGFMRFRERLAEQIGLELRQMVGFGGKRQWEGVNDPIVPFLNHSDCDGHLTPTQCAKIAPRLREMVSSWLEDDYDKQQALLLAEGMEMCAADNVNLGFC